MGYVFNNVITVTHVLGKQQSGAAACPGDSLRLAVFVTGQLVTDSALPARPLAQSAPQVPAAGVVAWHVGCLQKELVRDVRPAALVVAQIDDHIDRFHGLVA